MNDRILMIASVFIIAATLVLAIPASAQVQPGPGAPNAEKIGWRLGCQAYSFNRFTFYEAIEKNQSLGLHVIEAYPGQVLSKEKPDVKMDITLTPEQQAEVKAKLDTAGIKLVNFGVCDLPNDEATCRKTFDFAKAMGIETIVSEPLPASLPMIDKLCNEYNINVAIHNHPKPSKYWSPDRVLEACKGCSKRIGSCADTGHWVRSGVNPLEALKKLEGRIISFHFKDLNEAKPDAHDVVWGQGVSDVKALLTEIKRQNIQAVFSIEYEHNWDNSVPEIAQCVKYFDEMAVALAGK